MENWEHKKLVANQSSAPNQVREGDVFGDERHAEQTTDDDVEYPRQYEVVFVDDNRVTLRNLDQTDDYRHEHIPEFLNGMSSRWTRLSKGQSDESRESIPDFDAAIRLLKRQREQYAGNGNRKGDHVAEGIDVAIDLLREMEPTPVEWTTIGGVGPETATNLEEAEIETDIDAVLASDEELLEIAGVGEGIVENIRSDVELAF